MEGGKGVFLERPQYRNIYSVCNIDADIWFFVPKQDQLFLLRCRLTAMKKTKWILTIAVITWTKIFLFLTGMPARMKMTPEDLNHALESLPIPLEGPISTRNATPRGYTGKSKA
jgi:hypothetical protein